jgi:hypothetical protein
VCVCAFVLCFARRRMQLGGKKLHREGTVNRCVFDFLRTVGIFETSCFEFFVLFQKKKNLAVVMVQKQYEQKFVPGTKKW